jgi:hypothetical protein
MTNSTSVNADGTWQAEMRDAGYSIFDAAGRERCRVSSYKLGALYHAHAIKECDKLREKVATLEAIIAAKLHQRRCWDCHTVFYAADAITPYCLCDKCGSQDTRLVEGR